MAVKIRLTRMGKKKQPSYRVVVMDSRKPRDGRYIDQIGFYDPRQDPSLIEIDNEKAVDWLRNGAQPTERAQKLLEISGAWTQFRVAKGDIHTVDSAVAESTAVGDQPSAISEDTGIGDQPSAISEESVDEASADSREPRADSSEGGEAAEDFDGREPTADSSDDGEAVEEDS